MKILILGATGYLGSFLYESLSSLDKYEVFGSSRRESFKTIKADLLDGTQLNNLLKEEDFDIIINSAGHPSPDFCESRPRKALELNTLTSINLIKSLKKIRKKPFLINISTIYVYGDTESQNNENDITQPINYYGFTKLLSELMINHYYQKSLSIRLPMLIGNPYHPNDLIMNIYKTLVETKNIKLENIEKRYPLDVLDVVNLIKSLIKSPIYGQINFFNKQSFTRYQIGIEVQKCLSNLGLKTTVTNDGIYPDPTKWSQVARRHKNLYVSSCHEIVNHFAFTSLTKTLESVYLQNFSKRI